MILITLIYTFTFNSAFAQNSDTTEKERVVDFESVELKGKMQGPTGSRINENDRAIFNPLVQLRTNFSEEMQNSIDNL